MVLTYHSLSTEVAHSPIWYWQSFLANTHNTDQHFSNLDYFTLINCSNGGEEEQLWLLTSTSGGCWGRTSRSTRRRSRAAAAGSWAPASSMATTLSLSTIDSLAETKATHTCLWSIWILQLYCVWNSFTRWCTCRSQFQTRIIYKQVYKNALVCVD